MGPMPRQQEQRGPQDRGRREPDEGAVAVGIAAASEGRQGEMDEADEQVGDAEQDGLASKRFRNRQRDDEHRRGRSEHRQPDAALVHVHRAGQRGIGGPRPPERREDEHPAKDSVPRRVVSEQLRDLRDREHENEVEEELERCDLVFLV